MIEWKQIPNFPDYIINQEGVVKAVERTVYNSCNKDKKYIRNYRGSTRLLKEKTIKHHSYYGYDHVALRDYSGKLKVVRLHRLLYETFIGDIPEGMVIDHIDGNKSNNILSNLRCVSPRENTINENTIGNFFKKVEQLDKNTLEVLNVFNSCQEAAASIKSTGSHISSVCNGKRKTAYGYKWRWHELPKTIQQFDLQGNLIKEYPSIIEAAKTINSPSIGIKACLEYGKKTYKNYIWKYKN